MRDLAHDAPYASQCFLPVILAALDPTTLANLDQFAARALTDATVQPATPGEIAAWKALDRALVRASAAHRAFRSGQR